MTEEAEPARTGAAEPARTGAAEPAPGGDGIVIRHRLLPKQYQFVTSTAPRVMYSGAYGAGKTLAVCYKAAARAATHPYAREFLCRKHLTTLKATTLKALIEGIGGHPPVLPPGSYRHQKDEHIITINGAGKIIYGGIDKVTKIKSGGFSGVGIDETTELTEEEWAEATTGRVRVIVPGLELQRYCATNPAAPSHHLARLFGCGKGNPARSECEVIHTTAYDNHHLAKKYIEDLERLTGVARKRYLLGEWCGSEGAVYDTFDRSIHCEPVCVARPSRAILAVDQGFTDAFVCLRVEVHAGSDDDHPTIWVASEVYRSRMEYASKIEAVRSMADGVDVIVVDPSAPELIAGLRSAGLPAVKARNEILPGIQRVQSRLAAVPGGRPGLLFDPQCVNLMREMESYEWAPESPGSEKRKDVPIGGSDHAVDCLRYAIAWLDAPRLSVARVSPAWKGAVPSEPVRGSLVIPKGLLTADFKTGVQPDGLAWQSRADGDIGLWCDLRQVYGTDLFRPWQEDRFVIGASIGAGLGNGRSVLVAARLSDRSKALELVREDLDPIEMARLCVCVALWLGGRSRPVIGWHATGPGESFGRHITQRLRWGSIQRMSEPGLVTERATQRTGWNGDADDLRGLLLTYAADLRSGHYIQRSRLALESLGRFVVENGSALDYLDQDQSPSHRLESGSLAIADAIVARMIERATWSEPLDPRPVDPRVEAAKKNPNTILGMLELRDKRKRELEMNARPWDDT